MSLTTKKHCLDHHTSTSCIIHTHLTKQLRDLLLMFIDEMLIASQLEAAKSSALIHLV